MRVMRWMVAISLATIAGCAAGPPPETPEQLLARRDREGDRVRELSRASLETAIRRLEQNDRTADRFDLLILSGGGDFGAFGAGFLYGWATADDPERRMPEFDMVSGTSTGAILAPLAFTGREPDLRLGRDLYAKPPADLVTPRGLLPIWPWNESLAEPAGLRREIAASLTPELLGVLRTSAGEDRQLLVATTTLDFGTFRPFDLLERRDRPDAEFRDSVLERILASSAVPGVFPPVTIDGTRYVDGGVTQNLWLLQDQTVPGTVLYEWRERYRDRPLPTLRIWCVVNNQIFEPPSAVPDRWLSVGVKGLSTSVRAALIKDLKLAAFIAEVVDLAMPGEIEFRYVSIPEDWRPPVEGDFRPETMEDLVRLGERLGRSGTAWKTVVPEPDGVGTFEPIGPSGRAPPASR
jgi:hypothetical protein